MNTKRKKTGRKLLSFLLTLAMVVGLMPGMSLTAYAADEVSENISLVASNSANLTTISGTHYSVSCGYMVADDKGMRVNSFGALTINARKGETISKVILSYSEGGYRNTLSASIGTFDGNSTITGINAQQVSISSTSTAGVIISAVTVYFEGSLSNPTVTLTGGANAKSSGGLLTQSYLPGAMDTVTYTALTGASFPEFENFTQNGVTVKRTSDTVVTISGTPTANTAIIVPDAVSSSKIVTWNSATISSISSAITKDYTYTANGITLNKTGKGKFANNSISGYDSTASFEFTTATGKFTNIEIAASAISSGGNWTTVGNTLKWNGTPSNSVSLSGNSIYVEGISSITFVIEMPTVAVTITPGSNMTKTTDSGEASQNDLSGAMTDVVYTADDGYYFPEDYSVAAVNGISVTRDSYTQITVSGAPSADASITLTAPTAKTTPGAPTTVTATDCTTADNNDGKLTGVTTAMEYKKSDATEWTAGTGSDITGLVPGTYYVRVKATETTNASTNQELTIAEYTALIYTVTYKVVNGTWSDDSTTDKTETVQSDSSPASVPTGMKASSGYTGGAWDTNPAEATITGTTTFTYTFTAKQPATVSKAPEAKTLTYNGSAQELVTAGTATGGEMQYALGTKDAATEEYTPSIPTATDAGTYYVWYKAVGTDGHTDSAAACVTVTISEPSSGGGGGGYTIEPTTETAPSTPTETYTIPVENESSVNVQADIQNGNAKVTEITEEDIHKVTEGSSGEDSQGKTVDNNTILIDLSGATQKVKSVELSKTTMERLAETATSTENKIETVTVQLTNVTVELDAKTLSAVAQQAEGNSINLVVEDTNASTLNSDQQQALSEFTSASTFEAYFESAGSRIHDFKGGEATVSMKFTPAQGLSITHYHVYYVATSGKLERFVTRFIKTLIKAEKSDKKGAAEGEGILQFTTTHFSDYAIVYDETMENATGQEEADDTSSGEDKTKTANGKSSYENGLSINKGLKVSQKGETIQISWGKVKGADGYDVYVQYCGKAFSSKPAMSVNREVTSVTIKKINGKKLNLKKNYKIFVVAYKNVEGKKKRLAKSIVAHIVGVKNTRYSNPKELTITSDTDVTLEKGKTSKIKARVILANAKRKSLSDAYAPMFRYASSDKKIATVDKKGKITAKKQGSCLIWVYAKNGYAKKVKVTVK